MALILKKESRFHNWYEKNKQHLSEKRKKLYQDPEYRQQVLEASRRRRRGEPTLLIPPEAPISFAQAAERTGISISTLHAWRRKHYFPEPTHHGHGLWFSEKQVFLLKNLKEILRVYGKRPWKVKQDRLKEVVACIGAGWDQVGSS